MLSFKFQQIYHHSTLITDAYSVWWKISHLTLRGVMIIHLFVTKNLRSKKHHLWWIRGGKIRAGKPTFGFKFVFEKFQSWWAPCSITDVIESSEINPTDLSKKFTGIVGTYVVMCSQVSTHLWWSQPTLISRLYNCDSKEYVHNGSSNLVL